MLKAVVVVETTGQVMLMVLSTLEMVEMGQGLQVQEIVAVQELLL
jgi:hypothetical protein